MSKNSYWISDPDGVKAFVDGADERDRWVKVHGWTETSEPEGQEFVWLQNADHGGRAKFNAQAVPLWQARGWSPSAAPEPVNLALPFQAPPATAVSAKDDADADATPSKATSSKSAANATSGDKKE